MLQSIASYVANYTQVIATITKINVEVADHQLVRIAGTGMYAQGIGESIEDAGEIYRHVLRTKKPYVMTNPRENELCRTCQNLANCHELLSLCTPIMLQSRILGVIGIVCFTEQERERVLSKLEVFQDFVMQMANAISLLVSENQKGKQTQHLLDMFLQITDSTHRGIFTLSTAGTISYINDLAKKELGIDDSTDLDNVTVRPTGNTISNMQEFEVSTGNKQHILLGHLTHLPPDDETFHQALVFDSLSQYTKLLSQATSSGSSGLDAIIGSSRCVLDLKERVRQIARTSSTVLITGESGTGKEMFARAIHMASDRSEKPFIPINCGAIPDTLLESELFGYVSGAFTGANPRGHIGKFELAHQGILFLDEISAMPLYLQVKLLRVLQDKMIMRLGSNRQIEVDVRIIAATNDNLYELIEQRMFRDDLYYRLNVIPLHIAPLRERREDIPHLASYFIDKYCHLFAKKRIALPQRVLDALGDYHWPGNIREFENVMEYFVNIIPSGGTTTLAALPAKILKAHTTATQQAPTSPTYEVAAMTSDEPQRILPLATIEREAIQHAIAEFGNTAQGKKQAAEALGIGLATLYRKLKDYE